MPMSAAFMAMKCIDQIAPPPSATAAPVTHPSAASRPRAWGIAIASCSAVYEPSTEMRYDSPTRSGSYAMVLCMFMCSISLFYRSHLVGHRVGAVRLPPCPARRLLHLRVHAERPGVQEALHEARDEVAAIDVAARAAEWAVGQHDPRVARLDPGELLERRNQRPAQRGGHPQRIAERPLLAIAERADLLARLEQRLAPGLEVERAAVGPHQRDDVGKLARHLLDERGSRLCRRQRLRLLRSAVAVESDAEHVERRVEGLDLGRELLLVDLREIEPDLQKPGTRRKL